MKKLLPLLLILCLLFSGCEFALPDPAQAPESRVICIDAGHGGGDGGAVWDTRCEKNDNLSLALAVADELTARGFTPLLTRSDDTFLPLATRSAIANEAEAAYFISLHRNSAEGASGVEIWAPAAKTAEERKLAHAILNNLKAVGVSKSRGVKYGTAAFSDTDYAVNRDTDMPSCIVELGFITSETDNELFDSHFSEYAAAIADAIASLYPTESEPDEPAADSLPAPENTVAVPMPAEAALVPTAPILEPDAPAAATNEPTVPPPVAPVAPVAPVEPMEPPAEALLPNGTAAEPIIPTEPAEIEPEPAEPEPDEPTGPEPTGPEPTGPELLESFIKFGPTRFTAEMGQNYIPANRIICLDPGHGGRDGGAVCNGRVEKDDNLSLALAVADELTARGFTPVLTRSDDSAVSLSDRPAIANEAEASYFVSLHRNSVDADANLYSGVEIWVSSYRTEAEKKLANAIMDGLNAVGISLDRGVLFGYWDDPLDDYRVNRLTLMPSCIVELGFITSETDNDLFDEHCGEYAAAIADAIASLYPAA